MDGLSNKESTSSRASVNKDKNIKTKKKKNKGKSKSNLAQENSIASKIKVYERLSSIDKVIHSEHIESENVNINPLITDSVSKDPASTLNNHHHIDSIDHQNEVTMKDQEILKENNHIKDVEQDKLSTGEDTGQEIQNDVTMKDQEISKENNHITDFEQDNVSTGEDTVQETQNELSKKDQEILKQNIYVTHFEQDDLSPGEDIVQENQNELTIKDQEILKQNNYVKDFEQDELSPDKDSVDSQTIISDQNNLKEHVSSLKQDKETKQNHSKDINKSATNLNKMSNRSMIGYLLLAIALTYNMLYNTSTSSDNTSMKTQLDRAMATIEDLNVKVRDINDEKTTLQDKLNGVLTHDSDNVYHSEIIRITSERNELEIKLQEAINDKRLLQKKLDHALTEKNYLQAHEKEVNPSMKKELPDKSKQKNEPSDWISFLQSGVSSIHNMPIYFLFSFQIIWVNLMCSVLFRDTLSPSLFKTSAYRLKHDNLNVYKLLNFICCILGYPVSCELIGFLGWMTGFSVTEKSMLNFPKPSGLMVRSGSDIMSDWVLKDKALLLWLLTICIGGIITFISYMWHNELEKRLKTAGVIKKHILMFTIFTLILLNQFLYRIFSWFTGVTIGPLTFVNWLGARKAVGSLLSIGTYSIAALFIMKLCHVSAPSLLRNFIQIVQKLLSNGK